MCWNQFFQDGRANLPILLRYEVSEVLDFYRYSYSTLKIGKFMVILEKYGNFMLIFAENGFGYTIATKLCFYGHPCARDNI